MIFKKIILFLLLFKLQLYGQNTPIAISLGTVCPVAYVLRAQNIRTVAYPFDWVVVPFDGLYQTLEKDFSNFFQKKNLTMYVGPEFDGIIDVESNFVFFHDFPILNRIRKDDVESGKIPSNFMDFYDEVYDKYLRRIYRFSNALNSFEKVILIRYLATKNEAILLRDLFLSKYPLLDFILVIINDDVENRIYWDENLILNYYMPPANLWNSNSEDWLNIFYETKLLQPQ
ncbi:MAG: hypothetical protein H0X29_11260 [Parachlamydiaceae bacterium]|nr:hypothetical protein [Parachlamydiaceae bacterium]